MKYSDLPNMKYADGVLRCFRCAETIIICFPGGKHNHMPQAYFTSARIFHKSAVFISRASIARPYISVILVYTFI